MRKAGNRTKKKTTVCHNLCIIDAYVWFGGLMFEVGLYYIGSHETTYCTPTPFFSDTVKCITHERIIHRIRYK